MAAGTNVTLRNQVMYSVYVRNYSEEGTFAAVERDLDRIKELGVDVIWFMPIHPVGEKAKKGELGSPYANKDYRSVNPDCLWLSESIEPEFITYLRSQDLVAHSDCEVYQAFDICYDYDIHKLFRDYVDGKCPLSSYTERINLQEAIYPANYVKLRCLENHDQDRATSFIKTEEALRNWTAFMYFQKGMTLLYNGQEVGAERRPDLFNKDTINWNTEMDLSTDMKILREIKKHSIFTNSLYSVKAYDVADIAVATHTSKDGKMVGVFSFKGKEADVEVDMADGTYINYMDGKMVKIESGKLHCAGRPIIIKSK